MEAIGYHMRRNGVTCPLAAMGYSRDGKRDRLQVNYGLVTDERGCPVAVSVFAGNESDSTTLMPQVEMVRNRFGIKTLVWRRLPSSVTEA